MLNSLRRLIPKPILSLYHLALGSLANAVYRSPSDRLIVIGVTGTSGKSTVIYLVSRILEHAGFRVGAASTMLFKVNEKEWLNDKKMTMIGRFALQRLIKQMADANCQYALIETTSEGIKQHRHRAINYDMAALTNLYEEHLEAHGGFDYYKAAKFKLFTKLQSEKIKFLAGQKIAKTIIVNLDNQYAEEFLQPWAQEKFGYTVSNHSTSQAKVVRAEQIKTTGEGSSFMVDDVPFAIKLLGAHNVSNALAAIAICQAQGLHLVSISKAFLEITNVPGRLEFINEGQLFQIIVDYAFEPKAVQSLYQTIGLLKHKKIIHVLGSTGGGRDRSRRSALGKLAGGNADVVIVTDEDPYDDDPQTIIDEVAAGAQTAGKVLDQGLFKILDRRAAINRALSLAGKGDTVLITGKGSEQAMVVKGNKKIPWDDRTVVREELKKI